MQINEIVESINKIVDFIDKNDLYKGVDATPLTSAGVKISILKATLGDMVSDLNYQYEMHEAEYKLREAELYLKYRDGSKKLSIDDAKMTVKLELADDMRKMVEMKGQVDKFKTYIRHITDLVTNMQSRVSLLRHERNEIQLQER